MVQKTDVHKVQKAECFLQRRGPTSRSNRHGDRNGTKRELRYGCLDRIEYITQRVGRFQEVWQQDGDVSLCLHHLREDMYLTKQLCTWSTLR